MTNKDKIILHTFSDASQIAFTTFMRVENESENNIVLTLLLLDGKISDTHISFVQAKTRVVPIRFRLEVKMSQTIAFRE